MEIWRPIREFPSYECSNYGGIRNVRTQYILKPTLTPQGDLAVNLRRDDEYFYLRVHRIVAEAFFGEHPGMDVRHKDLDKLNNHVDNLYWISRSDAIKQLYSDGRRKPWREVPVRVLENGRVYKSFKECALDIGCDPAAVRKCANGERASIKGYHIELV